MRDVTPPTLLTEWARLLIGALRRAGVRDVVLSPGSRNTPFTWAALQDAELRCRTIVDERAAAFFAVGHARVTGRPVLLVCTSGSAAANYWPAVVEAAESGTPLLILTADRPLELQHAAAPQTIDQVRIYGAFARAFFDLGTPDAHPAMLAAVPRIAAQAVLAATSPAPGPVHLNARARKPLEPLTAEDDVAEALRARVDALLAATPAGHGARLAPDPAAIDALAGACRRARRGLIVPGPESPWRAVSAAALAAAAEATGFPVVAETASQRRLAGGVAVLDGFEALLGSPRFRDAYAPDLVLHVGRPPTASGWNPWLRTGPERWVLAAGGWPDPWNGATVVHAEPGAALEALAGALAGASADGAADRAGWRDALARASREARAAIEAALDERFSEGAAVRAAAASVPDGGLLALGNSLPIREADVYVPAADRDIVVWSQRGANGIDGLIAGAAGAAAAAGRPATLLLGDVSFAHDIGGLAAARDAGADLAIVVLDNGGGRIFEQLPLAATLGDDPAFRAWLTPPRIDFEAAAAAYGLPFAGVADGDALRGALEEAARAGGVTVIRVVVPAEGPVAEERDLVRRIEARLFP